MSDFIFTSLKKNCGGIDYFPSRRANSYTGLLTGVVEQTGNLGSYGRHDGAVEQCVKTGKQKRADNHGNQDFDAAIYIAFCFLASDIGLYCDCCTLAAGLNSVKKLFYVIYLNLSYFLFVVDVRTNYFPA